MFLCLQALRPKKCKFKVISKKNKQALRSPAFSNNKKLLNVGPVSRTPVLNLFQLMSNRSRTTDQCHLLHKHLLVRLPSVNHSRRKRQRRISSQQGVKQEVQQLNLLFPVLFSTEGHIIKVCLCSSGVCNRRLRGHVLPPLQMQTNKINVKTWHHSDKNENYIRMKAAWTLTDEI